MTKYREILRLKSLGFSENGTSHKAAVCPVAQLPGS